MKIICVGRNYPAHITELKNEKPDAPVIFLKPETALVKHNEDVFYPPFTQDLHHEVEIILRICKEGKYVQPAFANNYFDAIGLGIDFTARDLQTKLKEKGLPWEISKSFNQSAPVSEFILKENFLSLENINFRLSVNKNERQNGNSSQMLYTFSEIICYASQFFTLKTGDIIFTGTPAGVQKVDIGDHLEGWLIDNKMLDFRIK